MTREQLEDTVLHEEPGAVSDLVAWHAAALRLRCWLRCPSGVASRRLSRYMRLVLQRLPKLARFVIRTGVLALPILNVVLCRRLCAQD